MRSFIIIVIVISLVAYSQQLKPSTKSPVKPVWPDEFTALFGLNVPATNDTPAIINRTGQFYYNWDQVQSTLVVYQAGCLPGIFPYSYDLPCSFYFNKVGFYMYLPNEYICCLAFPGVGSIPPAFLEEFNYTGFDNIAMSMSGEAYFTHFWANSPSGFQYWTNSMDKFGADIQFQDGGILLWNWGPLNVTSVNPNIFELPEFYCNVSCPGSLMDSLNIDRLPMFKLAAHYHGFDWKKFSK